MELKKLNNMYTVELLNESKFAKPVILNWFKQQMLNSFQGTELTKEQIEQYIEDTLAEKTFVELININPRMMFDVFDENEIYIFIKYMNEPKIVGFFHTIKDGQSIVAYVKDTRKEAELSGIIEATKILNNKLEQLEKDKILTDEIL